MLRFIFAEVWNYIHENWLEPYKHKFVCCWIDDRRNFGEHTTNRVEGQHANLKRFIEGTNVSMVTIAEHVLQVIRLQKTEIRKTFEQSRIKVMEHHRLPLFEKLRGRVSHRALDLLYDEYILIDKLRASGSDVATTWKRLQGYRVPVIWWNTCLLVNRFP